MSSEGMKVQELARKIEEIVQRSNAETKGESTKKTKKRIAEQIVVEVDKLEVNVNAD